jgi:hypothetical protein
MAENVDWNQLIGGGVGLVLLIGGAYWYESRDQAPTRVRLINASRGS